MGRNLFDTAAIPPYQFALVYKEHYAFIIDHDVHTIGLISNQYYYLKNLKTGKEEFVSMTGNEPVPVNAETNYTKNHLKELTDAYYETAKYLLLNNKKKP